MTVLLHDFTTRFGPSKRRTATSVLAGDFDSYPHRDVLTSLLNGVPPYQLVEKDEEERRARRREKKERHRERRRARLEALAKAAELMDVQKAVQHDATPRVPQAQSKSMTPTIIAPAPVSSTSSYFFGRPNIHVSTTSRLASITPPPVSSSPPHQMSTPATTPGPSGSSISSRTSSKRPHTPDDLIDIYPVIHTSLTAPPPRKKRVAVKKGWKGWVEGSPEPSEKLINLDTVHVLNTRRTRSGKNFDAYGEGKDGWI